MVKKAGGSFRGVITRETPGFKGGYVPPSMKVGEVPRPEEVKKGYTPVAIKPPVVIPVQQPSTESPKDKKTG